MNVQKAAEHTLILLHKWLKANDNDVEEFQSDDGRGIANAKRLLEAVSRGEMPDDKNNRWLGYAQCILVYEDVLTLEQCKTCNALA